MSLYHYTDALGLMGIVQHEALWATDARFLNDSKELHEGLELVYSRCRDMREKVRTSDDGAVRATEKLYDILPHFLSNNIKLRSTYVVSFSNARDNLRQWMAYCPKNAGYSIEFDSHQILVDGSFERRNQVTCQIREVDYHQKRIDEIISPESIIKEIEKSTPNIKLAALNTANELLFHCCAVKPHKFYDESETRIIIHSRLTKDHQTNFRSRSGIIIPYFSYPAPRSLIKEITIGPNSNMSLARQGLEEFLRAHSVDCIIHESECSLREF